MAQYGGRTCTGGHRNSYSAAHPVVLRRATCAVVDEMGAGVGMFQFILMALSAALLIISGVGYIGQKRVLGRMMGNFYGITSIANNGLSLANGGEFSFFIIIGLIYPVLTLILLNTTFKEDLVN